MSLRFLGDLSFSIGLAIALLAASAVWWFYRRDTRDSGPLAHWVLPTLRATAVALAILTLTGPVLRRTRVVGQLGKVVVCVDASASMAYRDDLRDDDDKATVVAPAVLPRTTDSITSPAEPDSSRVERATELLAGTQGLIERLRSTHTLSVSALEGEKARPLWDSAGGEDVPAAFDLSATASATNLNTPIAQRLGLDALVSTADPGSGDDSAQDDVGEGPRTAVVLLSDGRHTEGPAPLELATQLAARRIPLICVGYGDTTEPADLAVLQVQYPQSVSSKNRVRGTLVWKDRGPAGRPVLASIRAGDEVLWQQQLVTQDVPLRRTEFDFSIREVVESSLRAAADELHWRSLPVELTARLEPLAGEVDVENNASSFRLSAVVDDHRLLLIDGRSRWETRYVRNLFERDEAWDVRTLIAGPAAGRSGLPRGAGPAHFPDAPARLQDFALIILGEIDPGLFRSDEQTALAEYVARGGGVILVDGPRGKWKQLAPTPLGDLLPVRFSDVPAQHAERLQLTPAGADWLPLRLSGEREANRRLWQQLPPPRTLVGVEPLAGAEVLVEAIVGGKPKPAIVRRPFGAGQVLYVAFEDSWRWRYEVADRFHMRFWNQVGKAVMRPPFAVSDSSASLDTGPAEYVQGQAADIRVRLRDPDGRPVADATTDLLLWRGEDVVATINLQAVGSQPGLYRGRTDPLPPGEYRTTLRASGFSEAALKVRTEFRVRPRANREWDALACHESLLRELATTSGGAYLHEASAAEVADLLRPLSSGKMERSDTLLWRSYWWFWAILGLLSAEWLLRKRSGLL